VARGDPHSVWLADSLIMCLTYVCILRILLTAPISVGCQLHIMHRQGEQLGVAVTLI